MIAERVVLDTNVLISAVLTQTGPPRRVVDLVRADNGIVLFSDETFAELRHRILGSKFDPYVGRESRAAFVALLAAVAEWVPIAGARLGCRDPTDDKILETALMGRADHLVTGDRDLLAMSPFHGILIITPARFLARHGQTSAAARDLHERDTAT
ncbi:putative toxin-antitoxin system toxin component, PIN family [Candidatus Palauibacter sp.]|uniref:putative toxin-antitoxin system toxin component, PIN family n=1 Tax=Candidatus Palauibacter sp. TaxID=3101350 RepID=UPI003B52D01C